MGWYTAAHSHAVWVDFNERGRIMATDRDRLDLMNRISTNKLTTLNIGEGTATLFLTATARVMDHVVVLNHGESVLIITSAGRSDAFLGFLKRNIFWNDRLQLEDVSATTQQIALMGTQAEQLLSAWWPESLPTTRYHFSQQNDLTLIRADDIADAPSYWLTGSATAMATVYDWLTAEDVLKVDEAAYETLRIEAGLPSVGHELTEDYIPLELGLWDAISFNKGCYTGQEIIARMDSRGKLAKMMVKVTSAEPLVAGTTVLNAEGKTIGQITSAAMIPTDEPSYIGLAVIKTDAVMTPEGWQAEQGSQLTMAGTAGVYETDYQ